MPRLTYSFPELELKTASAFPALFHPVDEINQIIILITFFIQGLSDFFAIFLDARP